MWSGPAKLALSNASGSSQSVLRKNSIEMLRKYSGQVGDPNANMDSGETSPMADESRNSYFRRSSMLPVSTISKAVPPSLLQFVDAIRGILFALSQLHSALRQYLLYAVHAGVAGLFNRVMEPAAGYMTDLINALDRFDSMSRRSTPPVSAIKNVIDATKECVAVFSKVVAVLRLQMPALRGGDVRYTRTLLLMIYGSMAEVGASWNTMEPLLAEIQPILGKGRLPGGVLMAMSHSKNGRTPISPIPERGESRSPSSAARSSISTVNASPLQTTSGSAMARAPNGSIEPPPDSASTARAGRSRRQGGSFSMEDVERGMLMSSPGGPPSESSEEAGGSTSMSYTRHRPSASAQIVLEDQTEESEGEEETLMPLPVPPFSKTSRSGSTTEIPTTPPELAQQPQIVAVGTSIHSRRGHQTSSSAGSLSGGLSGPMRKLSVDVRPPTPASATLFDEDLLDVIETATEAAFTAWLRLAEDINASGASGSPVHNMSHHKSASQGSIASTAESGRANSDRPPTIPPRYHSELVMLLSRAEHITTTLRETLAGIRANPAKWNHSTLSDDAQAFIKIVVKVSEVVKVISATHTFPQMVRQSCSRLTQVTRECAILIQVSSLRPGSSTPAPIPPSSARPISPAYRSRAGTAESSAEDLTVPPHSAGWMGPPLAASVSSFGGSGGGSGSGLKGLQLPSRHAARRRDGGRDPPRSAQASQTAF